MVIELLLVGVCLGLHSRLSNSTPIPTNIGRCGCVNSTPKDCFDGPQHGLSLSFPSKMDFDSLICHPSERDERRTLL